MPGRAGCWARQGGGLIWGQQGRVQGRVVAHGSARILDFSCPVRPQSVSHRGAIFTYIPKYYKYLNIFTYIPKYYLNIIPTYLNIYLQSMADIQGQERVFGRAMRGISSGLRVLGFSYNPDHSKNPSMAEPCTPSSHSCCAPDRAPASHGQGGRV